MVRGLRGDEPMGEYAQQGVSVKEVVLRTGFWPHPHACTRPPLLFHPTLPRRAPCCFSGAREATLPSPVEQERSRVVSPAWHPEGAG